MKIYFFLNCIIVLYSFNVYCFNLYCFLLQLDIDYDALIDEKSNIYNEWPELSKKLETLLEKRVVKDKTFAKQLEETQLYEKGDGNKILFCMKLKIKN